MKPIVRMLPLLGLALAACTTAPLPPSSVSGSLVAASFLTPPTSVRATDETGRILETALDATAAFRISLAAGHSYRLDVLSGADATPVVFPRSLGRLDTTFRVSGLGAVIALGAVRRMEMPPATTFALLSLTNRADGVDGADGECVDGYLAGSTTPCVDDDGDVTCAESEDDGEEGGDEADAEESGAEESGAEADCVDGVDAATGGICIDGADEVDIIDDAPAGPVAVPEHNVSDDVAGCEDNEQEGEHED